MLTVEEAAVRLKFHAETIRKWIRQDRIKGAQKRHQAWHIPLAEVERIERTGDPPTS